MSRTPNWHIIVEKVSFPNGLVKASASMFDEVTFWLQLNRLVYCRELNDNPFQHSPSSWCVDILVCGYLLCPTY
jgi:hypothetical protein